MARRKQQKLGPVTMPMSTWEPTQFYWCIKCGHHGDFGKVFKIKKSCEECDYTDLTAFTAVEIEEHEDLWMSRFKRKK